jgi:hypothetical protein
MEKIRINAVLTSQPVFLSFHGAGQVSALVRGMTEYGQMTFCCVETDCLPQVDTECKLANSMLAHILMSSVRDCVSFYVETDEQGYPTSKVVGFVNNSKRFGNSCNV